MILVPKLFTLLNFPSLLWDAAMFITGNAVDAAKFYHESMLEILELVHP